MARTVKLLLGGRYKLSGELAQIASAQRAWDRWLARPVFIKILAASKIDSSPATRRFIDSAQALVRIDHPNVETLLDYGATDEGAPYHVMRDGGVGSEPLTGGRPLTWARGRRILLEVIAGVDALHRQRIVHGDISPHTVALIDDRARIVDFADAELAPDDCAPGEFCDDLRGIAALGFWLLTGQRATGRSPFAIEAALARTDAPPEARSAMLRVLSGKWIGELEQLRFEFAGDEPTQPRRWSRVIDAGAAAAAAAMLSMGLWSIDSIETVSSYGSGAAYESISEPVCESEFAVAEASPAESIAQVAALDPSPQLVAQRERQAIPSAEGVASSNSNFDVARSSVQVGSESQRKPTVVRTERFDLRRDLSPAMLVQRGIDLTHGRPTPEDDPRVPIVDGPIRARALFEAACARDYGKGCHMLGVQLAEGMIPDDGAGPVEYYRRGCALDYHRSCAALADLARVGAIDADVSLLDAKACLLAGPGSSYCLPKWPGNQPPRR